MDSHNKKLIDCYNIYFIDGEELATIIYPLNMLKKK